MTQAGHVKKAVGEFGASAKAKLNEGGQPEDQLRNPLEQLFAKANLSNLGTKQEYHSRHRLSSVSHTFSDADLEIFDQ